MAENWEYLFQQLIGYLEEENFEISEEFELSDEVWIRKEARALSKWIKNISTNGLYFKFITAPIEDYIYEPILLMENLMGNRLTFKTTNPPVSGGLNVYVGKEGLFEDDPIFIPAGTSFMEMLDEDLDNKIPILEKDDLISLKFIFENELTSPGTNLHFILQ